jgi:hypothetical protein
VGCAAVRPSVVPAAPATLRALSTDLPDVVRNEVQLPFHHIPARRAFFESFKHFQETRSRSCFSSSFPPLPLLAFFSPYSDQLVHKHVLYALRLSTNEHP